VTVKIKPAKKRVILFRNQKQWQNFNASRTVNILVTEKASTSETSVNFHQTTRRNIPEDSRLEMAHV
jgi:hypothetical protein